MDNRDSLTLHARRILDCLPRGVWGYEGPRQATRAALRNRRRDILNWYNRTYGTNYRYLLVD